MYDKFGMASAICAIRETTDSEALWTLEESPVLRNSTSVIVGTALDSWFKTAMISNNPRLTMPDAWIDIIVSSRK